MKYRLMTTAVILIAACCSLFLAQAGVTPKDKKAALAKREAEFYNLRVRAHENVQKALETRNLLDYSNELLACLPKANKLQLLEAMDVFARAVQPERIQKLWPLIAQAFGSDLRLQFLPYRHDNGDTHEVWNFPAIKSFFETFPNQTPDMYGGYVYTGDYYPYWGTFFGWMRSKGTTSLEFWLSERIKAGESTFYAPRNIIFDPSRPSKTWARHYDHERVHNKKTTYAKLRNNAKAKIIENPVDGMELIGEYFYYNRMLPTYRENEYDLSLTLWMRPVIKLTHATDNFRAAQWMAGAMENPKYAPKRYTAEQLKKAQEWVIGFLNRSLAKKWTDYDTKQFQVIFMNCSMLYPEDTREGVLRKRTKAALAKAYYLHGDLKKSQALVEELTGRADGTLKDLGPFLQAGMTQKASGQRVVENRIKAAEKENRNSVRYWLNRATYYRGREEYDQEEHALKEALKIQDVPSTVTLDNGRLRAAAPRWRASRSDAMRGYRGFLIRHKRFDDAKKFSHQEFDRLIKKNKAGSCLWTFRDLTCYDKNRKPIFQPNDADFLRAVQYELKKGIRDYQGFRSLLHGFLSSSPTAEAAEKRAAALREMITEKNSLAARYWLAETLFDRWGQKRDAEVIIAAYNDKGFRKNERRQLADKVFRVLLTLKDIRRATAFYDAVAASGLKHVGFLNGEEYYLGEVARVPGSEDLLFRMWKRKINFGFRPVPLVAGYSIRKTPIDGRKKAYLQSLLPKDPKNIYLNMTLKQLEPPAAKSPSRP